MSEIIRNTGEDEICRCPKCGYAVPRQTGTPCSAKICPKCKVPMK